MAEQESKASLEVLFHTNSARNLRMMVVTSGSSAHACRLHRRPGKWAGYSQSYSRPALYGLRQPHARHRRGFKPNWLSTGCSLRHLSGHDSKKLAMIFPRVRGCSYAPQVPEEASHSLLGKILPQQSGAGGVAGGSSNGHQDLQMAESLGWQGQVGHQMQNLNQNSLAPGTRVSM